MPPLDLSLLARGMAVAVIVVALLIVWLRFPTWSSGRQRVAIWGMTLVALLGVSIGLWVTVRNVQSPQEWDFLCFWVYGQALVQGRDPYDVEVLRELARPRGATEGFLDVHRCLYPPPGLAQFWPLGLLDVTPAIILWYAIHWSALVAVVLLLWRLVDPQRSWFSLAATTSLVFLFHSTCSTLGFAQVSFFILAGALLAMQHPRASVRGLALGVGAIVKPIGAIFALALLVRRDFKALAWMIVPALVTTVLFIAMRGTDGVRKYLGHNPLAEKIAELHYTEPINQSLLAVILRSVNDPPHAHQVFYPPFIVAAGLLTAITLAAAFLARSEHGSQRTLGAVVAMALVCYPGALAHYSVLLLAPLFLLWRDRKQFPGGEWLVLLIVATTYGLVWSKYAFLANLFVWITLVAIIFWEQQFAMNSSSRLWSTVSR